ncbi:hypothetical protein [Streptomyces sasae]|uniref:hypothetical protein n=1 Tax=Streptomyces sasae TaxID=1266772 RepID=UPI002930F537|nr:hypothetical protein [Streptomyces sasae]
MTTAIAGDLGRPGIEGRAQRLGTRCRPASFTAGSEHQDGIRRWTAAKVVVGSSGAVDSVGVLRTQSRSCDALGRVTAVWQNSRATSAPADITYDYTVSGTGLSGTVTDRLNDSLGYATSVTVYDSPGRVRQTQDPTPQGGRLISDSFYDSRGWVRKKNNEYRDPATTPTLALASVQDSKIPDQDVYTFASDTRSWTIPSSTRTSRRRPSPSTTGTPPPSSLPRAAR